MKRYRAKGPLAFVLAGVLIAALVIVSAVFGTGRSSVRVGYVGHGGRQSWSASYAMLTGRGRHTLYPEGNALHVEVETQSGSLSMEMADGEGNVIFSESDIRTSSFDVETSGKTVITIRADGHKGGFKISG